MGAGKSTALRILEELGAKTLSTDVLVHELYGDPRVGDAVVARWGSEVAPGGVVDRAAIATRAFASPDDRAWLEQLLWPLVGERMTQWAAAQVPPAAAAVVEVPLLFEAGMESAFDATVAVVADEALRRRRAEGRGHAKGEERLARQLSQEEKAQRATFVVRNDGTTQDLRRELAAVLAKLSG
jgi:dephospho-CoA kinase